MMTVEVLACIDAPHFYAGIVLWDDKVIEAADIVKYIMLIRLPHTNAETY